MQDFFFFNHNPESGYEFMNGNSIKEKTMHKNKHRELLKQSLQKQLSIQINTVKTLKNLPISSLWESSKDKEKQRTGQAPRLKPVIPALWEAKVGE